MGNGCDSVWWDGWGAQHLQVEGRVGVKQEASRVLREGGGEGREANYQSQHLSNPATPHRRQAHSGYDLCKSKKIGTLKPSLIQLPVPSLSSQEAR